MAEAVVKWLVLTWCTVRRHSLMAVVGPYASTRYQQQLFYRYYDPIPSEYTQRLLCLRVTDKISLELLASCPPMRYTARVR